MICGEPAQQAGDGASDGVRDEGGGGRGTRRFVTVGGSRRPRVCGGHASRRRGVKWQVQGGMVSWSWVCVICCVVL